MEAQKRFYLAGMPIATGVLSLLMVGLGREGDVQK